MTARERFEEQEAVIAGLQKKMAELWDHIPRESLDSYNARRDGRRALTKEIKRQKAKLSRLRSKMRLEEGVTHYDALGRELKVGDYVSYTPSDNRAYANIGKVSALGSARVTIVATPFEGVNRYNGWGGATVPQALVVINEVIEALGLKERT